MTELSAEVRILEAGRILAASKLPYERRAGHLLLKMPGLTRKQANELVMLLSAWSEPR